MQSAPNQHPKPRPKPRPTGKSAPKKRSTLQNAKYIPGVTVIDRSKGTTIPMKGSEVQRVIPSLLTGVAKCRSCYDAYPTCDPKCPEPLFVPEIDVYWTQASGYMKLPFAAVRKCEDIAMAEAKSFGMSCVILRSDHHNTAAEYTRTGRRTGRYVPADWHITLYHGDAKDQLLLQGHCYTFVGANTEFPQCKLTEGNRTILEPHEILEKLTLEEAKPQVYWGMNGSCGWIKADEDSSAEATASAKP